MSVSSDSPTETETEMIPEKYQKKVGDRINELEAELAWWHGLVRRKLTDSKGKQLYPSLRAYVESLERKCIYFDKVKEIYAEGIDAGQQLCKKRIHEARKVLEQGHKDAVNNVSEASAHGSFRMMIDAKQKAIKILEGKMRTGKTL
jgi:exonuclease VII small subunit